jgi:1-acyl-sn-glycerol-3-phosphate acyltransferase
MPPRPPLVYRALVGGVRFVVRVFFREVAVEGRAHIPTDRGGLLVAWHPNGLIDPALILAHFPGRLVFGARDGLLRWPLLGPLFRRLGTVPIYRARDQAAMSEEARRQANQRSLDALARELTAGSFAALFPEGQSHDLPHVTELKTGAARLYYRARALAGAGPAPAIIPVGLHYDRKDLFRSDVLVTFHPPLALPPDLERPPDPHEPEAAFFARCDRLTDLIEQALVHIVRATEDWQLHALMHRARTLIRAEAAARAGVAPGEDSIVERSRGFAQIWHGYRVRRASHPDEVEALRQALTRYHRLLRAMKLEDADLDQPPRRPAALSWGALLLQAVAVYGLLPPLLLLGYLVNGPVHLLVRRAARAFSSAPKDTATVKILAGFLFYPLAWTLAGVLAAFLLPGPPLLVGLAGFAAGFLSGVLVLKYTVLAKATARRLRVRLTRERRADVIAALRAERARLHDRFVALGEGLGLPEAVTDDRYASGG